MCRLRRASQSVVVALVVIAAFSPAISAASSSASRTHQTSVHRTAHACIVRRVITKSKRPTRTAARCSVRSTRRSRVHRIPDVHPTPTAARPTAASSARQLIVGLNAATSSWGTDNMGSRLDQLVSQTSGHWVREEFPWSSIEPRPGVFDFSYYDAYILQTAEHRVHVLPVLIDTPSWAGNDWNTIPSIPAPTPPTSRPSSGATDRTAASGLSTGSSPNAIHDVRALERAVLQQRQRRRLQPRSLRQPRQGRRDRRPRRRPERPVPARRRQPGAVRRLNLGVVDRRALPGRSRPQQLLRRGCGPPLRHRPHERQLPTAGVAYDGYDQIRRVEAIHQEFVNHGAGDKPCGSPRSAGRHAHGGSVRCTTAAGQAADLSTVFNDARTTWKPFVQAVFVYCWQDYRTNSTDPENDYGITEVDGTPQPALAVFRAQAAASALTDL